VKPRFLLLGAGKKSQCTPARFREIAGSSVRSAKSSAVKTIAFAARDIASPGIAARLAVEGAIYAAYESDMYKTKDKEDKNIEKLLLFFDGAVSSEEVNEGIRRGTIVGEATNVARTLANEPSNILTPSQFAERAMKMGTQAGLSVQIIDHDQMAKMGMNALLAVSRGSEEPPKLIVLRKGETTQPNTPLHALIGKGVTFDSGGISLKPSEKMEEMKSDMAGGAAVLGAMIALAKLPSQNPIIGLIPAVENLPSGKATKPGDVVTSYLGKTTSTPGFFDETALDGSRLNSYRRFNSR